MIKLLHRSEIDDTLYNQCIETSENTELYAFSWYLDIVAENWNALVLDDYKAVMPLPIRKKYGITYVYQPLWTLQLGIFGDCDIKEFVDEVSRQFRYIEIRLNPHNTIESDLFVSNKKQTLGINADFSEVLFRKDRKKDLNKAQAANLVFKKGSDTDALISLFKNNVGKRTPNITDKEYLKLSDLSIMLRDKGVGEVFEVYEGDDLVAAALVIKFNEKAIILVSSTDFKNRDNGSNTFLIAKTIEQYKDEIKLFDFGGSSIPSIASYFKSFGAKTIAYPFLKVNNLPFVLKLFKS